MDNWDLQAIVRGCSSDFAEALMVDDYYKNSQSSCFVPFDYNEEQHQHVGSGADYGFSHCFDGNVMSVFDELDELYKPFYPQSVDLDIHDSSIMRVPPSEVKQTPIKTTNAVVSTTMPKRRKSTSKRVVKQVTVDDLSLDTWAWRKYGQKPIKGSPYPRSYYRCSTSKACSSKKQVERSNSNPTMFIVTYTDDHNHSHPIRRSTLAGKSKQKLSKVTSTTMPNKYETSTLKESSSCSPISSTFVFSSPVLNESSSRSPISSTSTFSPSSPLMMSCVEDQFLQLGSKQKIVEYDEQTIDNYSLSFTDASTFENWFSDQNPMTFQW